LETGGKIRLSERDMEVYGLIVNAETEIKGEFKRGNAQMRSYG